MRRIFSMERGNRVPDGTLVYPFLNSRDSTGNLPWGLLEEFSLAAGEIEPLQQSKIHVMPMLTQVTLVLQGCVEVWMKDPDHPAPYSLRLEEEQAVMTRAGTFFQMRNDTDSPCRVLYIVSPAYLFVIEDGRVLYDDSVVFDEDWKDIERAGWKPEKLPPLDSFRAARRAAEKWEAVQPAKRA